MHSYIYCLAPILSPNFFPSLHNIPEENQRAGVHCSPSWESSIEILYVESIGGYLAFPLIVFIPESQIRKEWCFFNNARWDFHFPLALTPGDISGGQSFMRVTWPIYFHGSLCTYMLLSVGQLVRLLTLPRLLLRLQGRRLRGGLRKEEKEWRGLSFPKLRWMSERETPSSSVRQR
jgi:hypothetical protein